MSKLGIMVPFSDSEKLLNAVDWALKENWDRQNIIEYAKANSWDSRFDILIEEFEKIVNEC